MQGGIVLPMCRVKSVDRQRGSMLDCPREPTELPGLMIDRIRLKRV